MVTYDREQGFSRSIHSLERNYFRTKFEDELGKFTGNQGVGVISDTDPQPIIVNSHLGRYAVVTVARINNLHEIADDLLKQRMHLSEMSANNINQTEMVALLINMGNTFVEGINNVFQTIKGSCSMLVLTEDGIIAARDILGRTPLVIGHKEGAYAVSSETSSFPNLDYTTLRDIGPGEIVRLRVDGIEVLKEPITREQVCSFLWVYYGFPSSSYEGINVEAVRERNGKMMGQEDDTEADLVCGIPDSGVGMAIGYAEGHGIPYKRAVLKYTPTWPRSFTPSDQSRRNLVAKMKLIPNKAILQDKRVVFCDDSIVRGTQLRDNVRTFFECGAKEVHGRISCPPLVYGCPFIGFTASKSDLELITRRIIKDFEGDDRKNLERYATTDSPEYQRMVDEIARRLGLTTVKFAKLESLIESIGLPKCKVCTHCFDGSSYYYDGKDEK
jgi:amidophosphoribosyltransferase (EC 2.4.2.14)